jgi:hypothetical protein
LKNLKEPAPSPMSGIHLQYSSNCCRMKQDRSNNDKLLSLFVIMDLHHVVKTILILTNSVGDITVKIHRIIEGVLKTCFCKFSLSKHPNHDAVSLVYHTNYKSKLTLHFIS